MSRKDKTKDHQKLYFASFSPPLAGGTVIKSK
jgi:hypothetical protein